jgi:uncharacterized protein (DUF488 family)
MFYSIGHSNLGLDEFVAMLKEPKIEVLVDVRSFPRSRTNPVFNIDSFPAELAKAGIDYKHMRSLGGRRPKQKNIAEHINAMWCVQAFHNYADYAMGDEFAVAFAELIELAREKRTAIMCSEAVWWRCHRRIIVDHLLAKGLAVEHILPPKQITPATLTPGAIITPDGHVIYPAALN